MQKYEIVLVPVHGKSTAKRPRPQFRHCACHRGRVTKRINCLMRKHAEETKSTPNVSIDFCATNECGFCLEITEFGV